MKATPYILTLFGLVMLLITGCDQSKDSQTGNEAAKQEEADVLQNNGLVESQTLTARQNAGNSQTSRTTSRSLLDNIASNNDLSTFNTLLRKAGIAKNLSGTGPYTVFAPTEAAFLELPDTLRNNLENPANNEQVQQLLDNHIIAGKLTTSDLQDGAILKTAAGHQLKVAKRDDKVQVGNALLEKPDGLSSNGVLHTINKVLIPVEETVL